MEIVYWDIKRGIGCYDRSSGSGQPEYWIQILKYSSRVISAKLGNFLVNGMGN